MLDPNERKLYIQALRPPSGYVLDRAIGTTFTLNLLTLLAVPLSFAKFDLKTKDKILEELISILEAVRRASGKFYVFCQNGGIKVPSSPNPLFQYLEKMVVEVSPPNPEGIFHPKIWVLRFKAQSGNKVIYRFLCLSRNITFDKSWDTILTIEGEVKNRYFAKNRPLSDFIGSLPGLAKRSMRKVQQKEISEIAEEIRHVDFNAPPGYEDFFFWPLGIPRYKNFSIPQDYLRLMIVSPFLTDGLLQRFARKRFHNILISRTEELDLLKPETWDLFQEKYVMDEAAGVEEDTSIEISSDAAKKSQLDAESDLSGLHAKLFLVESGWDAHLWTGSANATTAAFDSINVEFMLELKGRKSKVGIDKFIPKNKKEGTTTFFDLLQEYIPPDKPVKENEKEKELERQLERIQRRIVNSSMYVQVLRQKKSLYDLELRWPSGLKFMNVDGIEAKVWPISLKSTSGLKINLTKPLTQIKFASLSIERITGFFAFKLEVWGVSKSFVLNLPLRGVPENREDKILQSILSNRENFLRYLWLLLYEGDYPFFESNLETKLKGIFKPHGSLRLGEEMPIFEELVRAYSRAPEKIKRITQLLEDLGKTEEGKKILPEEFKLLWETFKEAKLG